MERELSRHTVKQNLRIDLRPLTEWEGRISAWEFFYTSSMITSCVFTLLCASCATNTWSVPEKKKHSDLETVKTQRR